MKSLPRSLDETRRAALMSVVLGILILTLKWYAFGVSHSIALQSDAIESIVNVVAAAMAYFAVSLGGRPADEDHPYGHGKVEHFSAAIEGSLILFAAGAILVQAVRSWVKGPDLHNLGLGMWINLGAGLLNGALGWYLVRVGRRTRSHAVEADGHHVLSDFYSTLGVLAGLLGVRWLGWLWLDTAIAGVVGLILAWTGVQLIRRAGGALMDVEDPEVVSAILDAMEKLRTPDLIAVHALRTMRSGSYVHADVHVVVPEFYDVRKAHDLVEEFGARVIKASGHPGETHAHLDPCARRYCESCRVDPCPIRRSPWVSAIPLLTADPEV